MRILFSIATITSLTAISTPVLIADEARAQNPSSVRTENENLRQQIAQLKRDLADQKANVSKLLVKLDVEKDEVERQRAQIERFQKWAIERGAFAFGKVQLKQTKFKNKPGVNSNPSSGRTSGVYSRTRRLKQGGNAENAKVEITLVQETEQSKVQQLVDKLKAELNRDRARAENRKVAQKEESVPKVVAPRVRIRKRVQLHSKENPHQPRRVLTQTELHNQIAELKATAARERDRAEQQRVEAEHARREAVASRKRAEAALQHTRQQHGAKEHPAEPHERVRQAMHRLENIRAAAKHLHEAGLPDLARAAEKHGAQLEREIHAAQRGNEPQLRELIEVVTQLRKQVQELQKSVDELKRRR